MKILLITLTSFILIQNSNCLTFKWIEKLKSKFKSHRKNKSTITLEQIQPDVLESGPLQNLNETRFLEDVKKNISLLRQKENWVEEAIPDIAYYLRAQKMNDFDRRYYLLNDTNAPRNLFQEFPDPPLRSLHWEVNSFCQDDFVKCIRYLWGKVKKAALRREEDSSFVISKFKSNMTYTEQEVLVLDNDCWESLKYDDKMAIPFQGPIERFQWRTTASYFLCWYIMNDVEFFEHFNERCDNFAHCLDPTLGAENQDPRASDYINYACAFYSICPDPCCPIKHIHNYSECWNHPLNLCSENQNKECHLKHSENTDFRSIVLNEWNVTCQCELPGFRWSSKYGMCIDIDECVEISDLCDNGTESCINLKGSYQCICQLGFEWDLKGNQCVKSSVLDLITKYSYRNQNQNESFQISDFIKLIWHRITKFGLKIKNLF